MKSGRAWFRKVWRVMRAAYSSVSSSSARARPKPAPRRYGSAGSWFTSHSISVSGMLPCHPRKATRKNRLVGVGVFMTQAGETGHAPTGTPSALRSFTQKASPSKSR